jgi:hypothetical protein
LSKICQKFVKKMSKICPKMFCLSKCFTKNSKRLEKMMMKKIGGS